MSYWFELYGEAVPGGSATLDLYLVAPSHLDAADLFPNRPAGLPVGGTCVEQPGPPARTVVDGTYLEIWLHRPAPPVL